MIRSMTAFGTAQGSVENGRIQWDLRVVNHRFLDLHLRLPEPLRALEGEVRERLRESFQRGRVECSLSWCPTRPDAALARFNRDLICGLIEAARDIESLGEGPWGRYTALDLLRWPGVLEEVPWKEETLRTAILALLDEALAQALKFREREGQKVAEGLDERCLQVMQTVRAVRARLPEVLRGIREKLVARLTEITANPDPSRLEQELVYLAQKMDVAEELDRLTEHAAEMRRLLQRQEPVGRRLDFLLQEMNREANTLAAKSADLATTRAAVDIKVWIEQMREQVQNVE